MKKAVLEIKRMVLTELKPHKRNPRKHPKPGSEAWELLKESLRHDYFDPIVLNTRNGMLVSGHLRTKILIEDGFTEADVVIKDYDEETHMARMLAANKQIGEYEWPDVKDILAELGTGDFEMDLTGFALPEIEGLMTQFHMPEDEPEFDENIETKNKCPQCGYEW